MPDVIVRKSMISVEEIFHEGGPATAEPVKHAVAISVINNPFAGQYVEEIQGFMDDLTPLGQNMAAELIEALGGDNSVVDGYGKGALVGSAGELEHGALWHVPGGYSMREQLPKSLAIVPSTKKVGSPGSRLDIPITHCNASYVRSHFDAVEVGINDAPRANELLLVLVMTCGGRVHSRVGGLAAKDIEAEDGLR